NLVSRYWAQLKLADLSANVDRNEAEITALGKQFNLVTPYTSMIVLETLDQYLRHKIVPPRSRGEIYAQFMQQIEQRQAVAPPAGNQPAPTVNSPTPEQTVLTRAYDVRDLEAGVPQLAEDGTQGGGRRAGGEVAERDNRSALFNLGVRDPAKADVNGDAITE